MTAPVRFAVSVRPLAVAVALFVCGDLHAQTGSISGTVASVDGRPIPYSTVSVRETGRERFTDAQGSFTISSLAAGTYHLRIRQLGFTALDTVVAVRADAPVRVQVMLTPIAFKLATVTVRDRKSCVVPGVEQLTAGSDLDLILTEVRKNAEREKLLATEYPFEYSLLRELTTWKDRTITSIKSDTASYRSNERPPYAPGRIVRRETWGSTRTIMVIPILADIANPEFLRTHCFSFAGAVRNEGGAYRVDFKPVPTVIDPDVEGTLFLDRATFVIRRATFRLTRPERVVPPIKGLEVSTTYRQIRGGLTVVAAVESTQPMVADNTAKEKQKLVDVVFLKGAPGDSVTR